MIYQLVHTTPYLSGQVRMDLVTDKVSGDGKLNVDEVHVMPISDSVYYSSEDNQVSSKHTDNIARLYSKTQDTFYSDLRDISLSGDFPSFSPEDRILDTVDHTYMMGCRRHRTHGKSFSFFLPMWIDSEDYIDSLNFVIHVLGKVEDEYGYTDITQKRIVLSDRVRKYLKDYLSGVSENVLSVSIADRQAYITGVNAENGSKLTKDVSNLIDNLTDRERPLMEFDNMLIRQFSDNRMIAQQLVNLCFCFDLEDIFDYSYNSTMLWNALNVFVEPVLIDKDSGVTSEIELKDIYSNYQDIYSYKISDKTLEGGAYVESADGEPAYNVLDYLQDDKDIDIISKNKITQPTIHWALAENPEYTYNLYNGFSPLFETVHPSSVEIDGAFSSAFSNKNFETEYSQEEERQVVRVTGRYFDSPDIMTEEYSRYRNNINWIKVCDGTSNIVPTHFVKAKMNTYDSTLFDFDSPFGVAWSKGIKYNLDTSDNFTGKSKIYANICVVNDLDSDILNPERTYLVTEEKENYSIVSIVFVTPDIESESDEFKSKMTMLGVRRLLNLSLKRYPNLERILGDGKKAYILDEPSFDEMDDVSKTFKSVLDNVVFPTVIRFDKTIEPDAAPAPKIDKLKKEGQIDVDYTSEVQYYKKDDSFSTYLFRYGGKLIPQFIEPELKTNKDIDNDGFDDTEEEQPYWSTIDSGQFNEVWRKKQWNHMISGSSSENVTEDSIKNMWNYLVKQKFSPLYPSIEYFALESDKISLDKPFVREGYLGEVNWIKSNTIYYSEDAFTVTVENSEGTEMTEETVKDTFKNYVSGKGYFTDMTQEKETIILDYIYPMYSYSMDWEYSSISDTSKYDYTITFKLR